MLRDATVADSAPAAFAAVTPAAGLRPAPALATRLGQPSSLRMFAITSAKLVLSTTAAISAV
jgi:hypothetical protein